MPILSAFGAARTIPMGGSGSAVSNFSYDFDGTTFFTYPASSAFAAGTLDFSIECFVYLTSAPGLNGANILDFSYSAASGSTKSRFFIDSSYRPAFQRSTGTTGGFNLATSSITVSLNTWTYVAVSRVSGSTKIFVGSSVGVTSTSIGSITNSLVPYVGKALNFGLSFFDGLISNLRYNVGSGFSTATVPTSPLTAVATTKMLTCQSSTVKDNSVANGGGPWTLTNSGVLVSTSSPF
jgi:hypothetical protein